MELIASSRIVRAERRVRESRPFSERIGEVIRDLAASGGSLDHPLLKEQEGPTALILVTADRGLAGAYNANVIRTYDRTRAGIGPDSTATYAVGKKGMSSLKFRRISTISEWSGFSEAPTYDHASEIGKAIVAAFTNGEIGGAKLVYTEFTSMFNQKATVIDLLPVPKVEVTGGTELSALYEFEPDPSGILAHLLPLYVETKIFQGLLESAASEHAARRRAMSSATDNADGLIRQLTRIANQARQSEITSEIADIVGGAEALN